MTGRCSVPKCERRLYTQLLCRSHWTRARNGLSLDTPIRVSRKGMPETERFWDQVDKTSGAIHPILKSRCWLWTGSQITGGYALFRKSDSRKVLVHRHSFELAHFPIPDGMEIDHMCRVPHCVNPHHLDVVTPQENARRTGAWRRQPTCHKGHLRTDENLYIYKGHRQCKICTRERAINRREQRRVNVAV